MKKLESDLLLTGEERKINQFICSTFQRVVINEKKQSVPDCVTNFIQDMLAVEGDST